MFLVSFSLNITSSVCPYSPNPASTVTSLQLLLGQSASVVLTQRRNMDPHRPVSSANSSAPSTARKKAGERYKPYKHNLTGDVWKRVSWTTVSYLCYRWMGNCCVGSARCPIAVSCRRPRSRGRASAPPTPRHWTRKTTTPDLITITTTTNTDTAVLITSMSSVVSLLPLTVPAMLKQTVDFFNTE